MNDNAHINRIIKYFNGQLSAEEEEELYNWLKSDVKNYKTFQTEKARLNPVNIHHDLLNSALIEQKMRHDINRQFNRTERLYLKFAKIAAVAILLIGIGFVLSHLSGSLKQEEPKVVWFEAVAPRGEKSNLILPDGSKVWLNSESKLMFPSDFGDGNRTLVLTGEAYFDVEKMEGSVFSVQTKDYTIEVTGTNFNVTAYEDFGRTQTSLIEGKVNIRKGDRLISLNPGQQITYANHKFTLEEKNTIQSTLWKDNIFDFDRVTLEELVIRLERWYDVDIEMNGHELKNTIFSGVFKNEETIWQVLNTLELTLPFTYERTDLRKIKVLTKK